MKDRLGLRVERWMPFLHTDTGEGKPSFARAALNRRSHRNFIPKPLSADAFADLMGLVAAAAATDRAHPSFETVLAIGFLAHAVEKIPAGFYLMDAGQRTFGQVQTGAFAETMAAVCLDQAWLKNAGIHFLFMTHPAALDRAWGARGYRYAMIAAGRLGQAVYLACTTLGLGCCGIGAFYDEEARRLLSLDPDAALVYLVAGGHIKTESRM
jgi:SagB-type dehydrogenase family enzyme